MVGRITPVRADDVNLTRRAEDCPPYQFDRPQETGVDGLPGSEGVFLPCSFWLADCWHLLGRKKEARELFERLLDVRNDLGLLSEEYDPRAKRQLGNFPQAFSHVALVSCARILGDEDMLLVRRD